VVLNGATRAPLPRVLVRIDSSEVLAALTGDDGHFTIDGVPSGSHTITARRPGFQEFAASDADSQPSIHSIRAADGMAPLNLSLSPFNAIRVHVQLSTGVPATSIGLTLFRQEVFDGRRTWVEAVDRQTDPAGQSRFPGLSDGAYLIATKPEYGNVRALEPNCGPDAPSSMPGFAPVFFGASADSAGATPIHVAGGQPADVSLELAPVGFYLVRIAVAHAPAGADWTFTPLLYSRSGELLPDHFHQEKDHSLCAYLPDGAYTLSVAAEADSEASSTSDAPQTPTSGFFGSVEFSVDRQPQRGVRLSLLPSSPTLIHYHYEPAPPKPRPASDDEDDDDSSDPLDVAATAVHSVSTRDYLPPEAGVVDKSTYALDPTAPGAYWIHPSLKESGVCIGAVTAGGEDLATASWSAGPSGSGAPIDAVLRTDCANLKLVLPQAASGESAGDDDCLYLYAIPLFPSAQDAARAQIQPLSDPTVELDDLPPGPYRVFLFRSPRSIAYREPGALDALGSGQDITLQPGDRQTLILTGPPQ
jgi:hypothetical protein